MPEGDGRATTRSDFDSERDWDYSRLANWIEDNLNVDQLTAGEMADAALVEKYGGATRDGE